MWTLVCQMRSWATCRDPSKGGARISTPAWIRVANSFPKGYDPSDGNPTRVTSEPSLVVPENNEVSTNLCVFKCDGDLANYVCMAGDCPDNYGGCERAFWYGVSADGCGELASHAYDAGGQKIEDQESAHMSINGAHDIAKGVQALEEKGLDTAENM